MEFLEQCLRSYRSDSVGGVRSTRDRRHFTEPAATVGVDDVSRAAAQRSRASECISPAPALLNATMLDESAAHARFTYAAKRPQMHVLRHAAVPRQQTAQMLPRAALQHELLRTRQFRVSRGWPVTRVSTSLARR